MTFFKIFSTNKRLAELENNFEQLTRAFRTIEQEWDATSLRVTKTLRRLRSAEERRERAESDGDVGGDGTQAPLPLTSVATPPDRMARIRQQLAGRKEGD